MLTKRLPAVAGLFYPADCRTLGEEVNRYLRLAPISEIIPKALIVPHAGYIYSGAIAAVGYNTLRSIAAQIRRVVVLGPAHRVALRGLALPGVDSFMTPLGEVEIDADAVERIKNLPQVIVNAQAHESEHALEVQIPFLQTMLGEFKLLPLVVGMVSTEEVAEVLDCVWGGEETLIVISSDLSHYLPYESAQNKDSKTALSILQLRPLVNHEQACGATPINGLLAAARQHHLVAHLLDLRNSGDTAGLRDQVVGYGAFAFSEPHSPLARQYHVA